MTPDNHPHAPHIVLQAWCCISLGVHRKVQIGRCLRKGGGRGFRCQQVPRMEYGLAGGTDPRQDRRPARCAAWWPRLGRRFPGRESRARRRGHGNADLAMVSSLRAGRGQAGRGPGHRAGWRPGGRWRAAVAGRALADPLPAAFPVVSNAVLPMVRAIMSNRAGYLRMWGRLVGQVWRDSLLTVTETACLLPPGR